MHEEKIITYILPSESQENEEVREHELPDEYFNEGWEVKLISTAFPSNNGSLRVTLVLRKEINELKVYKEKLLEKRKARDI